MDDMEKIRSDIARWEAENDVGSLPEAESELGRPLKVVYTPLDVMETDFTEKIGLPGEYPFV